MEIKTIIEQSAGARGSKEAKYMALSLYMDETFWIRKSRGIFQNVPPKGSLGTMSKISTGEESMRYIRGAKSPIGLD